METKTRVFTDFIIILVRGLVLSVGGGILIHEMYVGDPEMLRTISVSFTGSPDPSPIAVAVSWVVGIFVFAFGLFITGTAVIGLVKYLRN